MPIVSVIRLGKSFGAESIFANLNFQIDPHDRVGLVGPNGAGKSTLLDILARREEPDEDGLEQRILRKEWVASSSYFLPGFFNVQNT